MKLYFDCTSGISGDMVLNALIGLGADTSAARELRIEDEEHPPAREHGHRRADHVHGGHDHSHRGHGEIRRLIEESDLPEQVKETMRSIYLVIARAEAKVHQSDVENVHFHEVGRAQAIRNIAGIAAALADLGVSEILCSKLHDGKGFIECSHGRIPVPVPAVMAMRETCDYVFVTDDVETEMVTPSGLGVLMGIGARYTERMPEGNILKTAVARGGRDTGKEGLKVFLIQEGE